MAVVLVVSPLLIKFLSCELFPSIDSSLSHYLWPTSWPGVGLTQIPSWTHCLLDFKEFTFHSASNIQGLYGEFSHVSP